MSPKIILPPKRGCICDNCVVRRDELKLMNKLIYEIWGNHGKSLRWEPDL